MFDFKNLMCLGVSEPTKQAAAQITAAALANRQGNQAIVKENEKNICKRNLNL